MIEINIIWKRFCEGDEKAFDQLYALYYRRLFAYCLGKLKEVPLAENMVADIFVKLWEFKSPETIEQPENWLFSVARNACASYWSKHNRRAEILEELALNFDRQVSADTEEIDLRILEGQIREQLNATDYSIWQLHREGYGNHEISEKLGMKEKTVANRKAMIKTRLQKLINNYLKENGKN